MAETPETKPPVPEKKKTSPALAAAEIFAGDTLFEDVMAEIKKERERQKCRERSGAAK